MLLHGLAQVCPDAPLNVLLDATAKGDKLLPEACRSSSIRWRWVPVDFPANCVRKNLLALPGILKRLSTTVFHSPDTYCFPRGGHRSIVTLHDVIPLTHRQYLGQSLKARHPWLWRQWLTAVTSRAQAVITVSDFSRQEIHRVLGTPLAKIHRIYNAVAEPPQNAIDAGVLPPSINPAEPFILYVGRHDPYKNLARMVLAFEQFLRTAPGPWNFVVMGSQDRRYPEPQQLAKKLGLTDRVKFVGYLPENLLDLLYRQAKVLMLPSLAEGFGLPVIEAMIRGTPVLTSQECALAEIAQNAAVLVDPASVESIANGLKTVLLDPQAAQKFSEAGRIRARNFTPERMASQHMDLYRSLMQ